MASGDTLVIFTAAEADPPAGGASAFFDTRNGRLVVDFENSSQPEVLFTSVMPRHYAGGDVVAAIHYAMTSATSGGVRWVVAFERIGEGQVDLDVDSFPTGQSVTATVPGTAGHVDIAEITLTNSQADSIAAGEAFRMRLYRDSAHAGDTATGDAELLAVEIREA